MLFEACPPGLMQQLLHVNPAFFLQFKHVLTHLQASHSDAANATSASAIKLYVLSGTGYDTSHVIAANLTVAKAT